MPLAYQLKITLEEIQPAIWRGILVSANIRLGALDRAIQAAMGWENCHLHMFHVGNMRYADPDPEWAELGVKDEWKICLRDVAPSVGDRFSYEYDMGDGWMHDVVVEDFIKLNTLFKHLPLCLAGARACPPEDCGGTGGYLDFIEATSDKKHARHKELLRWIGGDFDPEAFDIVGANESLKGIE